MNDNIKIGDMVQRRERPDHHWYPSTAGITGTMIVTAINEDTVDVRTIIGNEWTIPNDPELLRIDRRDEVIRSALAKLETLTEEELNSLGIRPEYIESELDETDRRVQVGSP